MLCLFEQTLRQRIEEEYREVVERRVVTGQIRIYFFFYVYSLRPLKLI